MSSADPKAPQPDLADLIRFYAEAGVDEALDEMHERTQHVVDASVLRQDGELSGYAA